jgi:DNA recombination protein RmuC
VEQHVILATPTTLIALLKAVSYGWRQETIAENTLRISALGKELYTRLRSLGKHFAQLGGTLTRAVETYNEAVGVLETRVLVSARRFHELKSTGTEPELEPLEPLEAASRPLQALEIAAEERSGEPQEEVKDADESLSVQALEPVPSLPGIGK